MTAEALAFPLAVTRCMVRHIQFLNGAAAVAKALALFLVVAQREVPTYIS